MTMNWYKKQEVERLVALAQSPPSFTPSPTQSTLPRPPESQQARVQPTDDQTKQMAQRLASGWISTMPNDKDVDRMVMDSLTKASRDYAPNKNQTAQKTRDELAKLSYYYVECSYFAKQIAIFIGQNEDPIQDLTPINQVTNRIAPYPDATSMAAQLTSLFKNIGKGNETSAKTLGYAMEIFKDSSRGRAAQIVSDKVGELIKNLPQDVQNKVKNVDNMSEREQLLSRRAAQDFMDAISIVLTNQKAFPKQLVQEVQRMKNTAINQWLKTLPATYFSGQAITRTVTQAPGYGGRGALGQPSAPAAMTAT